MCEALKLLGMKDDGGLRYRVQKCGETLQEAVDHYIRLRHRQDGT